MMSLAKDNFLYMPKNFTVREIKIKKQKGA